MSNRYEIAIDDKLLNETFESIDEANAFAADKRRSAGQKIRVAVVGTFEARKNNRPLPKEEVPPQPSFSPALHPVSHSLAPTIEPEHRPSPVVGYDTKSKTSR